MATQEECIENILNKTRYQLYYNDDCNVSDLLNDIKKFGTIKKYITWKKILSYLSCNRYNVVGHNFNALKLVVDLLDEKFVVTNTDYDKIMYALRYNYDSDKNKLDEYYIYLCDKFGICNKSHLEKILEINKLKPINKLNKYVIDYLNKDNIEKDYNDHNNKPHTLFLTILDMPEIIDEILYIKKNMNYENIDKLIKKFDIKFTFTYDYDSLDKYFTKIINNLCDDENINDFEKPIKKKSKSTKNIPIDDKIKESYKKKYTESYIQKIYNLYTEISTYIFEKTIDNIKDFDINLVNDDIYYELDYKKSLNPVEINILRLFSHIYFTKFEFKFNKFKYIDVNSLIITFNKFEDKLKLNMNHIKSNLYLLIDLINQNHINTDYHYDIDDYNNKEKNKYPDIFDYIEQINNDENSDNSDTDADADTTKINKKNITFVAKRKLNFVKYVFNIFGDKRDSLNENNISDFIKLKDIDDFIDFNVASNKKLLKNIFDNKILNKQEFDYKILLKLNFDNITMRNAFLTLNKEIIELLLENKYSASNNDLLNIKCKICDNKFKEKYDYYNVDNNYLNFTMHIEPIFKLYSKFNILMDKDVLEKFCKFNDFHHKFDYLNLKDYTIYREETDKMFNQIINEIINNEKNTNLNNICQIQLYIDQKQKSNQKLDINDLYMMSDYKMKFMLENYFNQNIEKFIEKNTEKDTNKDTNKDTKKFIENKYEKDTEKDTNKDIEKNTKKVIVKKIVKKVVKKE